MVLEIIQQLGLALLFLAAVFISISIPGWLIIKQVKVPLDDRAESWLISTVLGMVVFTLVAYGLAAVHLRLLMYAFPLVGIYGLLTKSLSAGWFAHIHKIPRPLLVTMIIGVIGQVAVNAPSGFMYGQDLLFYSSHGHDGVWHLALMNQFQKDIFPFQNPEYAGFTLQNYHFFVDLLMAELSRLYYFSHLDIYFRFMPIVFSVLMGTGAYVLVKRWAKDAGAGLWAVIFTYFAGSFGYLVTLMHDRTIGGESAFWVSQTQSVLGNPPHAAAFIIVIVFLLLLLKMNERFHWSLFWFIALLGGALVEFKVYAGVLMLGGLLVIGLWQLIRERNTKYLLLFLATLIIALIIYLPNSANSQDFLLWHPWWFIRTMVVAPDRLNWLDLELRRQTYVADHNWKRVFQLEAEAFMIFLIGNLGMRAVGFFTYFRSLRFGLMKNYFDLFVVAVTTAAFFIPVFFVQKGVAWNVIQFNQYFLLLFGFLAAISTNQIFKRISKRSFKVAFIVLLIMLMVPTQYGLLKQFYGNPPLSKVSNGELQALQYLHDHSTAEDIVLTAPFDGYARDKFGPAPVPISVWYDTGYIPALSGRSTLVSDHEQLDIMGYKIEDLLKEREKVFQSGDNQVKNEFLSKYHVNYIYLGPKQQFATSSSNLHATIIFSNEDAKLYKVLEQK